MKILSANQIRALDAVTISRQQIQSEDLMERAALAFVDWFTERAEADRKIRVFCGSGNNGGDGLAIARLLTERGYSAIQVYTFSASTKASRDFEINKKRLSGLLEIYTIDEDSIPEISSDEIVIDAIFGSGLTRSIEGVPALVIERINASGSLVVSVDIASGLFCDKPNKSDAIIRPDYTVSFQLPKLSFLLPANEIFAGEWVMVNIGLDQQFIEEAESPYFFTDLSDVKKILKARSKFSHKGTFGKALVIAGSYGMMGAAILASKACLRAGAGLCVTYIPQCGYEVMQTAVPESMVIADEGIQSIEGIPDLNAYNAIAVGPGIGKAPSTAAALHLLFDKTSDPVVIDADALNIIAEDKGLLSKIPPDSILTPHPKEFERMAGKSADDYDRLELLRTFAEKTRSYIVLKGAHTAIATPAGQVYFNSTGNPGMATGGSGDVLTGIIVSLLAQGYSSLEAALIGVYMHGYAGDVAAVQVGEPSVMASDIVDGIGEFYKEVY